MGTVAGESNVRITYLALAAGIMTVAGCASLGAPPYGGHWTVTVLGDSGDSRFQAIVEATQFWNGKLAGLRIPIHFDTVVTDTHRIPQQTLTLMSATILDRRRVSQPPELARIPGTVVIAFSGNANLT